MVNAIIQARLDSKRLPWKVLLPLGDGTILDSVVKRTKELNVDKVILLIPDGDDLIRDDVTIETHESVYDVNLVKAFGKVIEKHPCDIVVRVTADNPLFSVSLANQTIREIKAHDLDYFCPRWKLPDGMYVEVFKAEAFKRVMKEATSERDLRNVCTYFYDDNGFNVDFTKAKVKVFNPLRDEKFTVDTQEDYEWVKEVVEALGEDATFEEIALYCVKRRN